MSKLTWQNSVIFALHNANLELTIAGRKVKQRKEKFEFTCVETRVKVSKRTFGGKYASFETFLQIVDNKTLRRKTLHLDFLPQISDM